MRKRFYESKTVATGYLVLFISVLSFVYNEAWVQEYPKVVPFVGTVIGVLILVLRYLTVKPMELTHNIKHDLQARGWRK